VAVITVAYFVFNESPPALAGAIALIFAMSIAGNSLHQSFHVKGHWLERFAAFHELRAVHYVHHLGSTKINYAVFSVQLDWIMGSLLLDSPQLGQEAAQCAAAGAKLVQSVSSPPPQSNLGSLATLTLGLQPIPRAP